MKVSDIKKEIRHCIDIQESPFATELSKKIAKDRLIKIREPFGYRTPCLHRGCRNWVTLAWYCKRHYRY